MRQRTRQRGVGVQKKNVQTLSASVNRFQDFYLSRETFTAGIHGTASAPSNWNVATISSRAARAGRVAGRLAPARRAVGLGQWVGCFARRVVSHADSASARS